MSYIVIDDFKLGMDRRKERIAGVAGALWAGINGHINRGGSFERRKKFVKQYALPAGNTFGMFNLNGQLYVFGSSASPGTIPAGVNYQQLTHPTSQAVTQIMDVTSFGGNIYVIAQFANGDIFHYYKGNRVTDWDNVAGAITSNTAIAASLAQELALDPRYLTSAAGAVATIIAATPGTAFTISQAVTQAGTNDQTITLNTVQANQAAVAETPASFTVTVTGGTPSNNPSLPNQNSITTLYDANNLQLLNAPVPWVVSNAFTAQALANAINAQFEALALTGIVGYTASYASNVVTISAPAGNGSSYNTLGMSSDTEGNFVWNSPTVNNITNCMGTPISVGALSGGVNAVPALAQVVTATIAGTTTGAAASGTINFGSTNPVNGSTITLGGTVWTFVTSGATGNQTNIAGSLSATLTALAANLNASADTNVSQCTYTVNTTTLTVTYKNSGSFGNAFTIAASVATASGATLSGGGWPNSASYQLTVNSTVYPITGLGAGYGITCKSYNSRVWSVAQSLLEYCALNDPTTWSNPSLAATNGFINITNNDANNDNLVGIQQYQDRIGVFSRQNLQIWILSTTPANNTYVQSVQNTGALSIRSIQQYGNIDVFYLSTTGVRSVRARDASNAPAVNDVGVVMDAFIQAFTATLTGKQIGRACSVIEPIDGRYWLAIHNWIFVYSFYPGSKISAWTYYDVSSEIGTADITEMVRVNNQIYLRAGDNIYLFGGTNNATYPNANEIPATVQLPFLSANKLDTNKSINGFNIGCTGSWAVTLSTNPENDQLTINVGTFDQPTYGPNNIAPIQMPTALFAVNAVCNSAGPATISNMAIHFDYEE